MKIVRQLSELEHPHSIITGFVPTMGCLHRGHLELMKTARGECDRVVVSLFVNPTQFGPGEDFDRYPRSFDRDAELAEGVGVDVLFAPEVGDMYPRPGTMIHVPVVTTHWEGAARPGHFSGVATIVCKLFNIVRPEVAYFGLKDLQQCLVISRMTEDLNIPVRISLQPTVREEDGLALSSRNTYLTESERSIAPLLFRQLTECGRLLKGNEVSQEAVDVALRHAKSILESEGFRVDYFELIDVTTAHATRNLASPSALVAAAYLGKTRLIDNLLL